SAAFSGDGRFLVTAADDRTVCVWSLTDLDRIVQARGGLPGLVLADQNGRHVVAEVRRGPYQGLGSVRAGDVVAGVGGGGRLGDPGPAAEFHLAAAARKPGESLVVRRLRGGEAPQDVALRLGQAVDERKPLLTLFVARGAPEGERGWIGWNPFGPY